jgi:hypothetical protein
LEGEVQVDNEQRTKNFFIGNNGSKKYPKVFLYFISKAVGLSAPREKIGIAVDKNEFIS